MFQERADRAGYGAITTEIAEAATSTTPRTTTSSTSQEPGRLLRPRRHRRQLPRRHRRPGRASDYARAMARELREVYFVDGVRTAFGRAGARRGASGARAPTTWRSRSSRELLRRNPTLPPERVRRRDHGRDRAGGRPGTDPRAATSRCSPGCRTRFLGSRSTGMCAGALTAITTGAGEIAMGAADLVIAGGVEHMGHHVMGAEVDFNPRYLSERIGRRECRRRWARRRRTSTIGSLR